MTEISPLRRRMIDDMTIRNLLFACGDQVLALFRAIARPSWHVPRGFPKGQYQPLLILYKNIGGRTGRRHRLDAARYALAKRPMDLPKGQ